MFKVYQSIPDGNEVAALREKLGLTTSKMAELFCVSLRHWQRKEAMNTLTSNTHTPLKVGEVNFLLLLADSHPYYELEDNNLDYVVRRAPGDAEEVRQLRIKTGLTQKGMAELFGYKLFGWKSKESPRNAGTLKPAEYNFLMLLTETHPTMKIVGGLH